MVLLQAYDNFRSREIKLNDFKFIMKTSMVHGLKQMTSKLMDIYQNEREYKLTVLVYLNLSDVFCKTSSLLSM